jgi:rhamnose utilization protein RhaD (predicted bifunctional aldolase and dehydrogenase)/NAD(P)-dependent dehydrogenase (short-subunit alcohol dehydrogenase family)
MLTRWSNEDAERFVERYAPVWGVDLALRTYSARLLGAEKALVLWGGGNTSVKSTHVDVFGRRVAALFVKASGFDMAQIEPSGFSGLHLDGLRALRAIDQLNERAMLNQLRAHLIDFESPTPSVESLVHALLPAKYIDHTHSNAILALSNQPGGEQMLREVYGDQALVLPYTRPGFQLAKAAADLYESRPTAKAMIWMQHGLVTWGETACDAYSHMIDMVTCAEQYLERRAGAYVSVSTANRGAHTDRVQLVAPVVRGLLARKAAGPDEEPHGIILHVLTDPKITGLLESERGYELCVSPPLTTDHLVRTKPLPLWIGSPAYDDEERLRAQLSEAMDAYAGSYCAYVARGAAADGQPIRAYDPWPRIILLPGLGALCAGMDMYSAGIVRDITAATLGAKARIAQFGSYQSLAEPDLFHMEYDAFQRAKIESLPRLPLTGRVALVTGAAGAIGMGVCEGLLAKGCAVALADFAGERLDNLRDELRRRSGDLVMVAPFDVTEPDQVALGFADVIAAWGGVDIVVICTGIALVSDLMSLALEQFRSLERVNVEGTLNLLSEAGRHFRRQGCGGDIILISTKNVFSPGAKFGAYSATKAAAHQLARIASLEMAELGVRVNMIAPDAVFAHGDRRSGLWAAVGPDRARAWGLDEQGLEEYYRNRNLLKARITATHVANAVLYFATRQTPTTGATIPVDGGLPEATPR